jgi:hypothetical protein
MERLIDEFWRRSTDESCCENIIRRKFFWNLFCMQPQGVRLILRMAGGGLIQMRFVTRSRLCVSMYLVVIDFRGGADD